MKTFSIIFLFTSLVLNLLNADSIKELPKTENKKHLLTVFVHGTILPFPSISILSKTINNKNKEKSGYQKYQLELRKNKIYKDQPIGELGLNKINIDNFDIKKFNKKNESSSKIISQIHKDLYKKQLNQKYNKCSFYTFGWDGRLSKRHRKQWSEKFYDELINEIKNLKNIEINIIAHSHGGNVALNLAEIEKSKKQNLKINKLILFGTPIQSETSKLIDSALFTKIYNIFSSGDGIQTIDTVSTKDFFSKRKFENKKKENYTLPQKLKQIEIKVCNKKPTHCELWLFGWTKIPTYRKSFPINPLPLAAFSPLIIDFAENKAQNAQDINLSINKQNKYKKNEFTFLSKIENKDIIQKYEITTLI